MKKNWVIASLLFFIVGVISFRFYEMQRAQNDRRDIRKIPMAIGEWTAKNLKVTEREYDILETDNLIVRNYKNPKGESVDLFVIYSETNRRVCHPPVACLIGSGGTVAKSSKEILSFSNTTLPVNYLLVEAKGRKYLVLYWYMLGREFTNGYFTQQLRWVLRQATGEKIGGALVRMTTPILESEEAALERAKDFTQDLLPILTEETEKLSPTAS